MSEIDDLVERLREPIIADAFGDGRIASGLLSETLINERAQAADMIERLGRRSPPAPADAVAAEREACELIALRERDAHSSKYHDLVSAGARAASDAIAATIRARSASLPAGEE